MNDILFNPFLSSVISHTGNFIPLQNFIQPDINYSIDLTVPITPLGHLDVPAVPYATSNAIDKPVDEPQEIVPPQSTGNAIIPYYPPPATPVNAAAANVPARMGAVFLGSGSLGVIDLGGGKFLFIYYFTRYNARAGM